MVSWGHLCRQHSDVDSRRSANLHAHRLWIHNKARGKLRLPYHEPLHWSHICLARQPGMRSKRCGELDVCLDRACRLQITMGSSGQESQQNFCKSFPSSITSARQDQSFSVRFSEISNAGAGPWQKVLIGAECF